MSIGHTIKTFLCLGMVGTVSLHAAVTTYPFEVESGMVLYEIHGGAQLTPETNLTIRGNAKLRFKEWGEVKLEEESGVVETTGAIKHQQQVKRFEKQTKDRVITADYKNEQLFERKKSASDINGYDETASLTKTGQEYVAGFLCDVWEGKGLKKCMYNNIVLKLESHILNVTYKRVATKAVFNIDTSANKECAAPDYPIHEFALFKDNIKTKNRYKTENFCKILKDKSFDINAHNISYSSSGLGDKQRKKFINHMAKDIYKRQKKLLPRLLYALKKTRACLQTGENPFASNQCIENFSRIKELLGTQEDVYSILWDEKQKYTLLDKIEDDLIDLQSRIPCINRAKNITDLSACMK